MIAARRYSKAFFVSNQYIPDKKRAAEEDALSKKHKLAVHIFDLTWILNRVFDGHHEELATSALGMSIRPKTDIKQGPRDLENERDLEEVEEAIKTALQGAPTLRVADDALEAAILARTLERARTDIDGRFVRAQRLALEHGTVHQQALAFYEQAWTAYFWHEDLTEFLRLYQEVERLSLDTDNLSDAELLTNLWMLLATSFRAGDIPKDAATACRENHEPEEHPNPSSR